MKSNDNLLSMISGIQMKQKIGYPYFNTFPAKRKEKLLAKAVAPLKDTGYTMTGKKRRFL
ncbi:hypothetical protein DW049_06955 [Ruminococcus sp. AF41-9]|jgi:hypothetical protein|nr:hypothetical protein DW049_06955 [Ruminococcus sp. AF41-9]